MLLYLRLTRSIVPGNHPTEDITSLIKRKVKTATFFLPNPLWEKWVLWAYKHLIVEIQYLAFREISKRPTSTEQKEMIGASLVTQWLRIHLPMQGTRGQALVREDPPCCRATKPVHHNY